MRFTPPEWRVGADAGQYYHRRHRDLKLLVVLAPTHLKALDEFSLVSS